MAASAVRGESGDEEGGEGEEAEEVEGGGGGEKDKLPKGWDIVIGQPLAKSYLLSPSVDSEGKEVKAVKVYTYGKLQGLQRPSSRFPNGRFHEIGEHHFSWVKRRVQPQAGIVHIPMNTLYCRLDL